MANPARTPTLLAIEGDATIYEAAALYERVQVALQANGPIELDLAGVAEIDSAGVQILLLLKREADLAGRQLRLLGLSPGVREVLRMLDLRSALRG